MKVLLYSKVPFNWAYIESLVLSLKGRSKFSIISACSKRRSQFCMGKSGYVEKIPAIKWYFNILIACSAALRR